MRTTRAPAWLAILCPLLLALVGCQYGKESRPVAPVCDSTLGMYARMLQGDNVFSDLGASGVERMMITRVAPGGPADRAGIRAGALLLGVDGHSARDAESMIRLVRNLKPGRAVKVAFYQDGKRHSVMVKVARSEDVWGWSQPGSLARPVQPAEIMQ